MRYSIEKSGTDYLLKRNSTTLYTFTSAATFTYSDGLWTITEGDNTVSFRRTMISPVLDKYSFDTDTDLSESLDELFVNGNASGGASFLIASGEVDLSVSGTTELTYASGVNGGNHVAQIIVLEAANNTDEFTASANGYLDGILFNSIDLNEIESNYYASTGFSLTYPIYGQRQYRGVFNFEFSSLPGGIIDAISTADVTSVYEILIGATPPSTTQFRVNVKIYGITF